MASRASNELAGAGAGGALAPLLDIDLGKKLRNDHDAGLAGVAGRGLSRFGGLEIDIGIAQPSVQDQNRARDIRQRIGPVGGGIERQCALGADRNSIVRNFFHRSMMRCYFVRRPGSRTCRCKNQEHGPRKQMQLPHDDPFFPSAAIACSTLWNKRSFPSSSSMPNRAIASCARIDSRRAMAKSTPSA